jgi:hypothetical protein
MLDGTELEVRRAEIIRSCLSEIAPLSSRGIEALEELASSRDAGSPDALCEGIRVLASTAERGPLDPSLNEFLLGFVQRRDGSCRSSAVSSYLVSKYGKDRVLPVYLEVLRGSTGDAELAETIIRELSLDLTLPELTPILIDFATSKEQSPSVRLQAAIGLEHTTGLGPEDMAYASERDQALFAVYRHEEEIPALESMGSRWKQWWTASGAAFMRAHGMKPDGTPLSSN